MKIDFLAAFNKTVAVIFGVMMLVIILALIIGVVELFADIRNLIIEHKLRADYL